MPVITYDDPLWQAALEWWGEKAKADPNVRSNVQHVEKPLIGCETRGERRLAAAVAAHLLGIWAEGQ